MLNIGFFSALLSLVVVSGKSYFGLTSLRRRYKYVLNSGPFKSMKLEVQAKANEQDLKKLWFKFAQYPSLE